MKAKVPVDWQNVKWISSLGFGQFHNKQTYLCNESLSSFKQYNSFISNKMDFRKGPHKLPKITLGNYVTPDLINTCLGLKFYLSIAQQSYKGQGIPVGSWPHIQINRKNLWLTAPRRATPVN